MNTSKQVNVMIGLLFLAFLAFGAYILNEPNRQAVALEAQDELLAKRGAELFVNNCRTCHGLEGLGGEEGAIAPKLNSVAFLVLPEDNPEGVPATAVGEERAIRSFLFNTIACGRANAAMPVWLERYGGPLSETQINYIVDMITTGRWDLVAEIGHEHDVETGTDPATVVLPPTEAGSLAITAGNCGQYSGLLASDFRNRDPFAATPGGDGTATPTEVPSDPNAATEVKGVLVGTFFAQNCAVCHGQNREGLIGPALLPSVLTQSDEFYHDTIANGRPGTAMPAWAAAGLTDEEITHLVNFIKNVEP
jgi:mono/diheme cytochrome c family protein